MPVRSSMFFRMEKENVTSRAELATGPLRAGGVIRKSASEGDQGSELWEAVWWFSSPLIIAGRVKSAGILSMLRNPLRQSAASSLFEEKQFLRADSSPDVSGLKGALLFPGEIFNLLYLDDGRGDLAGCIGTFNIQDAGGAMVLHPAFFYRRSNKGAGVSADGGWIRPVVPLEGGCHTLAGAKISTRWQDQSGSLKKLSMDIDVWNSRTITGAPAWYGRGRTFLEYRIWKAAFYIGYREAGFLDLQGKSGNTLLVVDAFSSLGNSEKGLVSFSIRRATEGASGMPSIYLPFSLHRELILSRKWRYAATILTMGENVTIEPDGCRQKRYRLKGELRGLRGAIGISGDSGVDLSGNAYVIWEKEQKNNLNAVQEEQWLRISTEAAAAWKNVETKVRFSGMPWIWMIRTVLDLPEGSIQLLLEGGVEENPEFTIEFRFSAPVSHKADFRF